MGSKLVLSAGRNTSDAILSNDDGLLQMLRLTGGGTWESITRLQGWWKEPVKEDQ